MGNLASALRRKYIDLFYRISLVIKIIFSFLEIAAGIAAVFLTQKIVIRFAEAITRHELSEDPHDLVSNYILAEAHRFSLSGKTFIIAYLLSHGVVKLIILFGLAKNKLWSFYLAFVVFGIFIIYQIYRYTITYSLWLILLTLFDLFFLWLVWKEYSYARRNRTDPHAAPQSSF